MRFRTSPPLLFLLLLITPWAGGDSREEYEERIRSGHCPCEAGNGCWHYLRSPMKPPEDPCRCGACLAGGTCQGKDRPKGASGPCWSSGKPECFWKRHATSWKMMCSECAVDTECDACDEDLAKVDANAKETLKHQLEIEGSNKKRPLYIAVTPHFYLVTDLHNRVKVLTEGGAPRLMSGHEFLHLYAQRCELAYEDFVYWFGDNVSLGKPMAVFLVNSNSEKERIGAKYFGNARTNMLYGGGTNRISAGFAGNGFNGSAQDEGDDRDLHGYVRHMIGNILFSCWSGVSGEEKKCPKWAFEGAAHFLSKLLDVHKDYGHFCEDEGKAPSGSMKDWDKRARGIAAGRLLPIQTFFGKDSLGALEYEDHVRAWSLMDLGLREDRTRFLNMLSIVRDGEDEGFAFKEAFGITADDFNQRWIDRLSGKRKTLGEIPKDSRETDDDPSLRERRAIENTADPDVLAGLIRGLDKVKDAKTAASLISRLDSPSDLVRETIQLVLEASGTPEIVKFLREVGLSDSKALVRAGVARALAALKDPAARPALEALLKDQFWLARANAAMALGKIGAAESVAPLVAALDDPNEKTWISVCDALASFAPPSKEASIKTAARLAAPQWQIRVTACRGLSRFGTEEAIDPLIDRYDTETGRLHRELRATLKAVTKSDQGETPANWRKWWETQKKERGGLPPEPPAVRNPEDDRYAPPKIPPRPEDPRYYGRTIFSKSIGFVLDTSKSMETTIDVPPDAAKSLGDIPTRGTRFMIAKHAIGLALGKLDPRTRLTLVFFSTAVRPWKDDPVPAAPGTVDAAISAIRNAPADGETNIHGALKAVLGLHGKPTHEATLDPIPDTVYFLTDGSPTRGEITSTPELLGWFEDLNRFAKVELHVIALGNLGVDLPFLQALAAIGGGDYIHVPER